MYEYRAIVMDVYDGDTVTVDIDLGLNIWLKDQKIRLYGINAAEVKGDSRARGLVARDWLKERVMGKEITIRTIKDRTEKFGRWLAELILDGQSLNHQMVDEGLAVTYMLD